MSRVVFFSGGIASWAAAKRAAKASPGELVLLFTDTLIEDTYLYRFLIEGAANVLGRRLNWQVPAAEDFPATYLPNGPGDWPSVSPAWLEFLADLRSRAAEALPELVWISDGRTPWQVFRDEKLIGHHGKDPCSKILKRRLALEWLRTRPDLADAALVFGIGYEEGERFDDGAGYGIQHRWRALGWESEAPMMHRPWMAADEVTTWLRLEGLRRPRLYDEGMLHNNCGGACVKGGEGSWAHLLRVRPETYAQWEAEEAAFNAARPGRSRQTILAPRTKGRRRPATLREFRQHIERGGAVDLFDQGSSCDCFGATDRGAEL